MLTKESYLANSSKLPYTVVNIDGMGDVGLRLFRKPELKELDESDDLNKQVALMIIGEDGKRVFSDEDIEGINETMPFAHKKAVIEKAFEVNGLSFETEEIKKN